MQKLNSRELMNVNGGSVFGKVMLGILVVGTFFASVVYGYIHPVACE